MNLSEKDENLWLGLALLGEVIVAAVVLGHGIHRLYRWMKTA